jgi:acyl CoA:acetate/3-ketoacid CoA transferase beta subunit
MHDTMALTQAGYMDYGFLGAAQIDALGNINTTLIGDWERPKVRFPGSGGANDLGSLCHRTIVIMTQDEKKFVEKVEFVTTPGYLSGPGAREEAGLPSDTGPYRVITQLGVYGFDHDSKRMMLLALHPGINIDHAMQGSSFEFMLSDTLHTTDPPSGDELRILRELDPMGVSIGV